MPKLSERDVFRKFITPTLLSAGWNPQTRIREEVSVTKGHIIVRDKLVPQAPNDEPISKTPPPDKNWKVCYLTLIQKAFEVA